MDGAVGAIPHCHWLSRTIYDTRASVWSAAGPDCGATPVVLLQTDPAVLVVLLQTDSAAVVDEPPTAFGSRVLWLDGAAVDHGAPLVVLLVWWWHETSQPKFP
jgi:hypothetical protein